MVSCTQTGGSTDTPKKDPSSTTNVKVGDSCKGISANIGLVACAGADSIGCSSFTDYVWTAVSTCEKGEKCVKVDEEMTTCE